MPAISTSIVPDARLRLCDHRHELPTDSDEFFWGEGLFDRLGRFQGLNDEMRTIVLESLRAYPWLQLETAVVATLRQLVMVRTGWGVLDSIWHTHGMIENFAPAMLPAMKAARQQKGELDFDAINRLHVPVALASMLLLLGVMALGAFSGKPAPDRSGVGTGFTQKMRPLRTYRPAAAVRRSRAARHHRGIGDPRQCLRHRRTVGPARPLRRARGLDRHLGGRDGRVAGADARAWLAEPILARKAVDPGELALVVGNDGIAE